jgi:hypothetical protein
MRNPWDWYASWDAFNRANPSRNPIFRTLSETGRLDFKTTISRMLRLGENTAEAERLRKQIIPLLPVSIEGNRGAGITQHDLDGFRDPDIGYLTWLAHRMFCLDGQMDNMHIGHTEDLRADLLRILKKTGTEVSPPLRETIISAPPVNAYKRPHYRDCYDDELRELVAEKDRLLIERFEYLY